jgi:hypothetical protein
MGLLVPRVVLRCLAVCASTALVVGCGRGGSASRAGTSLSSAEVAYAGAVNLRAADVPGLSAGRFAQARTRLHGWLSPVDVCDGASRRNYEATGIASPGFRASLEHGGVLSLLPLEIVRSTVYPAVSPTKASRVLQAAVTARGRACLRQVQARAQAHAEDGSKAPLLGTRSKEPFLIDVTVLVLPSPLRQARVYALRTIGKSSLGVRGRVNFYDDFFAFVSGSAVVTMNATGAPHPVAPATERRVLLALYRRATSHAP